jgi:hypothetical protein
LTVGFRLRLAFRTDEPATARATLRVGPRSARAAHDFTTAGNHALTLKLSKSLLRLLRHRRSATLTLTVTDASGNVTVLKRTLKLRARRP